jgi:hypothetical protein
LVFLDAVKGGKAGREGRTGGEREEAAVQKYYRKIGRQTGR